MTIEFDEQTEVELVERILAAANQGSWHAAAYLLEHCYPERWAKKTVLPRAAESQPFDELDKADELAPRRRRSRK